MEINKRIWKFSIIKALPTFVLINFNHQISAVKFQMSFPNSEQSLSPIESEELMSIEHTNDIKHNEETWLERLDGLKEMFPDEFGRFGNFLFSSYKTICEASWVVFTTVVILLGPIMFESERLRLELELDGSNNVEETFEEKPSS